MRNFLVALAVFIIVVIGLGTVIARIAGRKDSPPPGNQTSQQKFSDRTTQVRFTTDGAIVGLENHRAIRITITQTDRTIEVLKGYEGEVIGTQNFANDAAAFTRLLIALDAYGYTLENPKVAKDERGTCPLGLRYIYEATYKSGQPTRSWSSSCGISRLQGNSGGIQQLFRNQIPNYNKLVTGVNLNQF